MLAIRQRLAVACLPVGAPGDFPCGALGVDAFRKLLIRLTERLVGGSVVVVLYIVVGQREQRFLSPRVVGKFIGDPARGAEERLEIAQVTGRDGIVIRGFAASRSGVEERRQRVFPEAWALLPIVALGQPQLDERAIFVGRSRLQRFERRTSRYVQLRGKQTFGSTELEFIAIGAWSSRFEPKLHKFKAGVGRMLAQRELVVDAAKRVCRLVSIVSQVRS